MSTIVTNTEVLTDLPEGTIVLVSDGANSTEWTLVSDGLKNPEGVVLPILSFRAACRANRVYLSTPHSIGDTIYSPADATFSRAIGYTHDPGEPATMMWAVISTDGDWRHYTNREPIGEAYDPGMARSSVLDLAAEGWRNAVAAERLEDMMSSGEMRTPSERTVKVEVSGTNMVQPTAVMAAELLGDSTVKISDPGEVEVSWSKTIEVVKSTPWVCACNDVFEDDVRAETPGEISTWRIIGCA